jgi:hypothetical protein
LECKRETLIKARSLQTTCIKQEVFDEVDSKLFESLKAILDLYYKSENVNSQPKLTLTDLVKASMSIKLTNIDKQYSKFD